MPPRPYQTNKKKPLFQKALSQAKLPTPKLIRIEFCCKFFSFVKKILSLVSTMIRQFQPN
jgi:hypothetical protein